MRCPARRPPTALRPWSLLPVCVVWAALGVMGGCNGGGLSVEDRDLAVAPQRPDQGRPRDLGPEVDLAQPETCGELDDACRRVHYGLPGRFPLQTDGVKDPAQRDDGLVRDAAGALRLDGPPASREVAWITNPNDLGDAGTVSKVDTRGLREVGRYFSVTCGSLKDGSTAACDGTKGCCSLDDWGRYQNRHGHLGAPPPAHQAVQTTGNHPFRTSWDFSADVMVANRAPGGQASVTRIRNDPRNCSDRNGNGRIDTSSDVDGNGVIQTDCNGDGAPDDLAGVKALPCSNGLAQEFYGLDDECVAFTVNVFPRNVEATAVSIGDFVTGPDSDTWVGAPTGTFLRINGATHLLNEEVRLPPSCTGAGGPWGMAIDASLVAWVTEKGAGKLCWFDARKLSGSGVVRDPQWGPMVGDGLTLDRDQNVWVGGAVARYTPDRSNGTKNLGDGWWTRLDGVTGTGIAADSRNARDYFLFSCSGASVLEIPASTLKVMKADQTIQNPGWPTIHMPCTGVGVDNNQNVWGIDGQHTVRALVDRNGGITQPVIDGPPKGNSVCPAGDSCRNPGAAVYSDFVVWARTFSRTQGSYTVLVPGCRDGNGVAVDTQWWSIDWDADVPPNTTLTVRAMAADAGTLNDPSWQQAAWTPDQPVSPLLLEGVLAPNFTPGGPSDVHDGWLVVEFTFKIQALNASPTLRSFDVRYRCVPPP